AATPFAPAFSFSAGLGGAVVDVSVVAVVPVVDVDVALEGGVGAFFVSAGFAVVVPPAFAVSVAGAPVVSAAVLSLTVAPAEATTAARSALSVMSRLTM